MTRAVLNALLSLSLAGAQQSAPPITPGLPNYAAPKLPTTPGRPLTPQEKAVADQLLSPPKIISTSVIVAVKTIIDERGPVVGLIGPMDRQIAVALERAGLHVQVRLAVGGNRKLNINNVTQYRSSRPIGTSIIVTKSNTIMIGPAGIQVWESKYQADVARQNLGLMFTRLPRVP